MIRGTTPTFVLTIQDESVDLSHAENVYVTIRQPDVTITKTGEALTVSVRTVECYLSQQESLQLSPDTVTEIQMNWTYLGNGNSLLRAATMIKQIKIGRQLLPEVLT